MLRQTLSPLVPFGCALAFLVGGCHNSQADRAVEQARRELQFGRNRQALNTLAGQERLSPEGHYLKAVALAALGQYDAAQAEIQAALQSDPQNAKYRGFQLRVRLFQRDEQAIEPLIELSRQHSSSAAVCLFAVFAREAKSVSAASGGQPRTAQAQLEFIRRSLRTSLLLAEEIPEFHLELVALALKYGFPDEARRLAEQLVTLEPHNADVVTLFVQTLAAAGQFDEAVRRAERLYRRDVNDVELAHLLARVLARSSSSPDHDRVFEDLAARFPLDADLALQHAVYLTRTGRLREACRRLNELVQKHPKPDVQQRLMTASISLPLEAESLPADQRVRVAEEQLQRYREQLADPALVTYYEGRLFYLQGRYEDALKKMLEVVQRQQKAPVRLQSLAAEALQWTRRILAQAAVSEQLRRAVEAVEQLERKVTPQQSENRRPSPAPTPPAGQSAPAPRDGQGGRPATSPEKSPAPAGRSS